MTANAIKDPAVTGCSVLWHRLFDTNNSALLCQNKVHFGAFAAGTIGFEEAGEG
jgi:hypothetical protein